MDWQLAEAQNKLSEIVTRAFTDGPQRINCRGQVVVVLAEAEYRRLTGEHEALTDYLLSGPDLSDLDLERDPSPMREVSTS